jgi:hypothetical protein
MDLQGTTKGIGTQRRRQMHRIPLNPPEVDFQIPNITIDFFFTFFGNTSENAEHHLFKLKNTCDVFNITEVNVTCRLYAQTLDGNACEWFFSLFLGTITCWDVLETSFAERFIPNVFNVAAHLPFSIWTQDNEESDLEEKLNQRLEDLCE